MTATRITIAGLEKEFSRAGQSTMAVDGVSLVVEPGEIFFLLGPSGCGKTTLLRMIAGFTEPTKGRILFDDVEVTWLAPNARQVGMVFQSYALWPHMTVAENVAFGLRIRKLRSQEIQRRVHAALDVVRMREYESRRPNELSGGQQQRVALARALVVEPKVLLLDEPLSNLDAKLRNDLRSEIRRICKQVGTTTVYVTHDQKEALAVADRIAVLQSGRVCQIDSPHRLYSNPSSTFVGGFLGEINLLRAKVHQRGPGQAEMTTSFGRVFSRHESADRAIVGSSISIGVRPERIALAEFTTSEVGFSGTITTVLFLGDTTLLKIQVGEDLIRVSAPSSRIYREGEVVRVIVDPSDVICFEGPQDDPAST